jgi:hypothetical protein
MKRLLPNSELRTLTDKYCVLDGEAPLLIKLLWDLRNFQESLLDLPLNRLEPLIQQIWEADQAIASEILKLI